MEKKSFIVNKGVNRPVVFKGLQAQYIWYVAGIAIGTLLLYGILFFCGLSAYVCMPLSLGVGGAMIAKVYKMSRRYGAFGLMKRRARRQMPTALVSRSRTFFIELFNDYAGKIK